MKAFGCVAALVCVTIGFASAGPVAVSGDGSTSMCDIQCGTQNKFKYSPGQSYVYKYSTKTETALEQSSDEKSTMYLDAEISLHVIDSCRFALKVDSAKLDEELAGGVRKASLGTQELAESLMRSPLVFNYENGVVSRLCPAVHESKSALNIKRGILSMIQNKMADLTKDDTTFEDDVVGECRAVYTVQKGFGNQVNIVKEKMLSECKRDNDQQVINAIALPRRMAKSSSMINGTQECRQVIKDSIYQSVECHERHVVKPFSRQEKGAATEIQQSLRFQRSGANIPVNELRYPEAEEETMQFDPIAESESADNQMEMRAKAIIQRLAGGKNEDIKETNAQFSELMESLRKLRYDSLKKLATEFGNEPRFVDALTSTLSGDAMKLVAERVKGRLLSTQDAKLWLFRVALATDVDASRIQMLMGNTSLLKWCLIFGRCVIASRGWALTCDAKRIVDEVCDANRASVTANGAVEILNHCPCSFVRILRILSFFPQPLLESEDIVVEAHLAVSSLARTYMEENPTEIPEEIHDLLRKLYAQLKPETDSKTLLATLKAIGNLGISNGQEQKLLETTAQKSLETRLAAIEAFRRFPCDTVKRDMLMNIFTRQSEDTELRVAAYLNSIMCPTEKMLATVRDTIMKEPKDSQMSSFVFTHVTNLAKRSSFHEDVSIITSNESLKSLELDRPQYSKNYFYEMFFNPLDMGFEIDANSIFTNKVSSFMLNSTFDIFGHKLNILDSKVRAQNDLAHLDGFLRFFGKEVLYKSVNGKSHHAEVDALLKSVLSNAGWKFSRSMTLLDSESIIPTGTGLPLVVAVNATASLDVVLKAMPPQGQRNSKFVADARCAPSLAVRFGVSMMTKAPKTTSGIRMVVTGSSQWDLSGRINVDLSDSRMIRSIQIDAPRDRSDIIDIKSDVYLVGASSQRGIEAAGTQKKNWQWCSGRNTHVVTGHEACVTVSYPEATRGSDAPHVLLRGPSRFNVNWIKTDKSLKMFQIQSSFIYGQRELLELAFEMDTPGSEVDRKFQGRLYSNVRDHKFGLDLISPMKKINLEGTYQETPSNKKTQFLVKIDGATEMSVVGNMDVKQGRTMILSPVVEVFWRNERVMRVKSEIASNGNQKLDGEVEIQSIWNQRPIKIDGEYSIVNKDRRLSLGFDSAWLQSKIQSKLTTNQGRNWDVSAEGDYSYRQGPKNTFSIGGKVIDDHDTIAIDGHVNRNGVSYASGRGKLAWNLPANFDMAFDFLEGRYKGALGIATENDEITLTAMGLKDKEKYATSIKFQQMPRLTSFTGKFDLPNNVEKQFSLQYDLASPVKRVVFETDLVGKTYSARMSYTPTGYSHKISAFVP
ncbi:uncharacterized protein LOC100909191 [Galendromus occidentalis]|uniref:Uncharacterized protein LOC100909191 n=1 Tax=Galendromus occidentalis TaxID=34638 RepID=A0AAJ7SFM7_9ACAR|nr:uncharacterized protein LOC100909191 [Galendromus occidentalis]